MCSDFGYSFSVFLPWNDHRYQGGYDHYCIMHRFCCEKGHSSYTQTIGTDPCRTRKGKSGGARVITFTVVISQQDAVLNLLYIYDKADKASISEKEIEQLLKQNGLKTHQI